MDIIVLGQQKGGVGKSTLAGNIAVALAGQGRRVIIVDADKQQTCVKWGSRRQLAGFKPTVAFAALQAKEPNASDFIKTLRSLGDSGNFDVCLVDVGGRDNKELRAAMAVCNVLVTPCLPSQADVESLAEFDDLIGEVMALNPGLRVLSVINRATTGLNFSKEIKLATDVIAGMNYIDRPLGTVTERPTFRKAWMEGQGVHDLAKTAASDKAKHEIDQIVNQLLL